MQQQMDIQKTFAERINDLVELGCTVIVDDICRSGILGKTTTVAAMVSRWPCKPCSRWNAKVKRAWLIFM